MALGFILIDHKSQSIASPHPCPWGFPEAQLVKNLPALKEMQETSVPSLGWEDPLEEAMATNSYILAWEIPWTEEPGGSQRAQHDRVTAHTHISALTVTLALDLPVSSPVTDWEVFS